MKNKDYRLKVIDLLNMADAAVQSVDSNENLKLEYDIYYNKVKIVYTKPDKSWSREILTIQKERRGIVMIFMDDDEYEYLCRASEADKTAYYKINDSYTGCEEAINHDRFMDKWNEIQAQYIES